MYPVLDPVDPVGGVVSSILFHAKPAGAQISAPLLVSLQEDEAMILEQSVSCLDFLVLDLDRSSGYVNTLFGWSSAEQGLLAI